MPRRKIIANLVGLVASATLAWSVHGLMLIGSCGGEGTPQCPPEIGPYVIGVFAGSIVAIVSAIAGGGLAFSGIFLAVGVGAVWAGFDKPSGGGRSEAFAIGGVFLAVTLALLALLPIVLVMRRRAMRLVIEGAPAIATVLEVNDTGTTINRNPRVQLKLRLTPQDGSPPFDGEKAMVVSRLAVPQPGRRYPAWYDRAEPGKFVIATDVHKNAPPEVRRLFELAQAESDTAQSRVDPLDRLAKLHELRTAGALTDAEFDEQKRKLLDEA